ncbi:MAG: hypothetical protein KAT91_02660 [Candidatus Aenigmarchaeota archaeon]|nr:hypothetical protein [Candidatus Aenigmarchaeota archaeon]
MGLKKGQMFIVGAFVLCLLLATVVIGKNSVSSIVSFDSTNYLFENLLHESKSIVNIIAKENMSSENIGHRILEYSAFTNRFGQEHKMNTSGYFIVAVPVGDDMNVSVINFEKQQMVDIKIRINGTEKTISTLAHNSAKTVVFTNVPDYMNFNYTYIDSDQNTQTQEENTTKRLFSFVKLRFVSGEDIKQSVYFN